MRIFLLILLFTLLFSRSRELPAVENNSVVNIPFIARMPEPARDGLRKLTALPSQDLEKNSGWQVWVVPYAAGLYALCCQAKPEITPVEFWKAAMETGDCIDVKRGDSHHPFGTVVNPERLLRCLSEEKIR